METGPSLLLYSFFHVNSDSLVVEAAGGELDAETSRKTDESGFRDSEVAKRCFNILCCYFLDKRMQCVI